jgi:isochorismate synthase
MSAVIRPGPSPAPCVYGLPPDVDAICRQLQAEAAAALPQLTATAPDGLVSLALRLPGSLVENGYPAGGDTRWQSPGGELALYGSGVAVHYAENAAARYRQDCRHWVCWGDPALTPLAFFTLPPATQPSQPALWLPRALLRYDHHGWGLVLTSRRGTQSPQQIVTQWLDAVRHLFTPSPGGRGQVVARHTTPDADTWLARVTAARAAIRAGRLTKVVLARRLRAQLSHPVDVAGVTARLASMYPACHVLSLPHDGGRVVAATPELLAAKRGDRLICHALAGTTRHQTDAPQGGRAALLASPKERHEHVLVVNAIKERMARLCTTVEHAAQPSLLSLRFVQHLWTPLQGTLRAGVGLLDAAGALHPTPAVLGTPDAAALDWLQACGERRDGLYTGVAGWLDRNGDGAAVVVVRSAWLQGDSAVLWAGAGIVAASDPAAELAETELKLQTMLEVLDATP